MENAPTLFSARLRLFPYVAKMAAVEYEKCASIHTPQFDRFEYTIRVLSVHFFFARFKLERPTYSHTYLTFTLSCTHSPCHTHIHPVINTFILSYTHSPCHTHIHHVVHTFTLLCTHSPCRAHIHPVIHTFTLSYTYSPCRTHIHTPTAAVSALPESGSLGEGWG